MKKIGILSDTHCCWDDRYLTYFEPCDEIWHAGDIGDEYIRDRLEEFRPLRAVFGNMDGMDLYMTLDEVMNFTVEDCRVMLTHIGGYPGHYKPGIRQKLIENKPDLFVCGHSHILKVMYDKDLNLLHVNPGAAGRSGIHQVRTLVRLTIDGKDIRDLEVIELADEK